MGLSRRPAILRALEDPSLAGAWVRLRATVLSTAMAAVGLGTLAGLDRWSGIGLLVPGVIIGVLVHRGQHRAQAAREAASKDAPALALALTVHLLEGGAVQVDSHSHDLDALPTRILAGVVADVAQELHRAADEKDASIARQN